MGIIQTSAPVKIGPLIVLGIFSLWMAMFPPSEINHDERVIKAPQGGKFDLVVDEVVDTNGFGADVVDIRVRQKRGMKLDTVLFNYAPGACFDDLEKRAKDIPQANWAAPDQVSITLRCVGDVYQNAVTEVHGVKAAWDIKSNATRGALEKTKEQAEDRWIEYEPDGISVAVFVVMGLLCAAFCLILPRYRRYTLRAFVLPPAFWLGAHLGGILPDAVSELLRYDFTVESITGYRLIVLFRDMPV